MFSLLITDFITRDCSAEGNNLLETAVNNITSQRRITSLIICFHTEQEA